MSGVARTYYPVAALPDTNARQPALTQRPASTALLAIDSEDRFANYTAVRNASATDSPYNFKISKPNNLLSGFFTRFGVTEVAFPWIVPNINIKSSTMTISYSDGGAPLQLDTLRIPIGFYTPQLLATTMADAISAATGITVAVVYGRQPDGVNSAFQDLAFTFSVDLTASPNSTIAFLPMGTNTATYPYPDSTKQLFDVLGLTSANNTQATIQVGGITFCQWTRYIDITCSQITNNQSLKDATTSAISHDIVCRLYVSAAPGQSSTTTVDISGANPCFPGCAPFTIYKDFSSPKQIQWLPNQNMPGFLEFIVYDDSGAPLSEVTTVAYSAGARNPLSNTDVNWSMSILATEN